MRGVISLGMLEHVERTLRERHGDPDMRLCEYFDLIGGTSTGAVIAAALAMGLTVAEVQEMYLEFGAVAFAPQGWRFWRRWRAKFDDRPLEQQMQRILGDRTLGDPDLRTGLCIIAKRADTGSTWRLFNHPHGKYYEDNRDILVRSAVRASVAMPTYFTAEAFEVKAGQTGAFVDGALSMANNPGLELFLVATLKGFPFRWPTGPDNLMVVSVGTGTWSNREKIEDILESGPLRNARRMIEMFMSDTDWHGQSMLQGMSDSPTNWQIDREIGDLSNDMISSTPALHYLRYNLAMDEDGLEALGFKSQVPRLSQLRDPMSAKERVVLSSLGLAAGQRQVKPEHFPTSFDVLPAAKVARVAPSLLAEPGRIEKISSMSDVVIRNLEITQFYYEAAVAMTRFIGSRDVTWFAFGVHASKTVGRRAMRFETLPAWARNRMMKVPPLASFLSSTREAMAEGNLMVFQQLAPIALDYLSRFDGKDPDPAEIDAFVESLAPGPAAEGGNDLLRVAFRAWYDAAHEPDPEKKAQLVLLGNCSAVYHEQQRLQNLVGKGFEVPVIDAALQRAANRRGIGPVLRLGRPAGLFARGIWQRAFTRTPSFTAYELPETALGFGADVKGPAPGIDFPPTLRIITEPRLLKLLEELGVPAGNTVGSASGNYSVLSERMRFIATVFRSRQQDLGLLAPPFSRKQVEIFHSGKVPPGPL